MQGPHISEEKRCRLIPLFIFFYLLFLKRINSELSQTAEREFLQK